VARIQLPQPQPQPSLLRKLWVEAWTETWGYLNIIVGLFITGLSSIAEVVTSPSVKDALSSVAMPAYVGLAIAVIGAVTIMSAQHAESS
jgi:hypothetical protein